MNNCNVGDIIVHCNVNRYSQYQNFKLKDVAIVVTGIEIKLIPDLQKIKYKKFHQNSLGYCHMFNKIISDQSLINNDIDVNKIKQMLSSDDEEIVLLAHQLLINKGLL